MKVITVTTYNVYNYGAALQAYALQTYLKTIGCQTQLLNYQPNYLRRKYAYMWVNPESSFSKYGITRWGYRCAKYIQRQFTLKRKKAFDEFISKHLNQTQLYCVKDDLYSYPPEADAYIVGSDQVWNTFYDAGRDGVFYLDFVKKGIKGSYAASFSFLEIEDNIKPQIKEWLSDFDAISVREYQGVDILNSLGLKGEWVLDPVFLLSAKDWGEIIIPIETREKYLLVYDFEGCDEIKHFAKKYAKELGLKIYNINDTYPRLYADKNFASEGPIEFLSLIYNCSAFISNSFHGTAFSLIFHKPFFVFPRHRHAVNSRLESILKMFGLEGRMVSSSDSINLNNIDWESVEKRRNLYLIQSKSYLDYLLFPKTCESTH